MTANIDPAWAWAAYQPSADSPWDLKKVGHLYRRAAFGAAWPELEGGLKNGPQHTIALLLQGSSTSDGLTAQMERSIVETNNGQQLAAWWVYRMLYSAHPLRERLTLFCNDDLARHQPEQEGNAQRKLRPRVNGAL
jgi:hypothetical protein